MNSTESQLLLQRRTHSSLVFLDILYSVNGKLSEKILLIDCVSLCHRSWILLDLEGSDGVSTALNFTARLMEDAHLSGAEVHLVKYSRMYEPAPARVYHHSDRDVLRILFPAREIISDNILPSTHWAECQCVLGRMPSASVSVS